MSIEARAGYRWCRSLARAHYENFPVASRLLPRRLRDPVASIYAFARSADDLADEGELGRQQRLERLSAMQQALDAIPAGEPPQSPLYAALADSVRRHRLPLQPFHDLLSAFRQDVVKNRYASFGELVGYCRRSANPIGRLLLQLADAATPRNVALSDAICSALQLTNFLQDIAADYQCRDRIYIPQDEMRHFGVAERDIAESRNGPRLTQLFRFQVQRSARLLRSGSPLGRELGGRLGFELRAVILSAARVLEKLNELEDIFARPRLHALDRARILAGALRPGPLPC